MVDMFHVIQFRLLSVGELAFPVRAEQLGRPLRVRRRWPKGNNLLRARATGEKLDNLAPVGGRTAVVLLEAAFDDFPKPLLLSREPANGLLRQVNCDLHIGILPAYSQPVNSGFPGSFPHRYPVYLGRVGEEQFLHDLAGGIEVVVERRGAVGDQFGQGVGQAQAH